MEAIYKRRSIRQYTAQPVEREKIKEFVKAGMNAPSAGNAQPWHFIIIDDRKVLNEIAEIHPYGKMLFQAPAAIVVCGHPSLEKHPGFWVQDCSAATENILLAIADQEYGGVWLGVHPKETLEQKLRNVLQIPAEIIPFCVISLGHPAEQKQSKDIYDEGKISINSWK